MGYLFSKQKEKVIDKNKYNFEIVDLPPVEPLNEKQEENIDEILKNRKNLKFENLVLEGGGIKGIAYCGAFKVLNDLGCFASIKNIAGSSAGAILGTLVALGYTSDEITDIMKNFDFPGLIDDRPGFIRDGLNIYNDFGYAEGTVFYDRLGKLVKDKTGDENYTLKQLYDDTGKTLVLTGCDLEKQCAIYFWHGLTPDLPIRKATRISMSYPFVFEPIKWNGSYLIDGGFADNFPIHCFDGEYPGDLNAIRNLTKPNASTLGLKLLVDDIKVDKQRSTINVNKDIDNLVGFGFAIVDTFFSVSSRKHMRPGYWERTVPILVPDISATNFNIEQKMKDELYNSGIRSMKKFLKR